MIDKLRSILKESDTVLFIGSGASLWSGIPTWRNFIKELSDFRKSYNLDTSLIDREIINGDLLLAASFGFDRLSKPQISEFIKKATRFDIAKPSAIHQKILNLGPTCYVTTNYDNLLELSFSKWQPDIGYRTVVNKDLSKTADIVGGRATKFLFKIHGDAGDSESIILTREHYRQLHTGGEFAQALDTLKTLNVSRTFVYIGFSLKDPDFLLIKDSLYNIYKGHQRDHFAIVADVDESEKDYYRNSLNIHITSYKTTPGSNNSLDHSQLLSLLDELSKHLPQENKSIEDPAKIILGLAKHAARYSQNFALEKVIPLVVHENKSNNQKNSKHSYHKFEGEAVEKILDKGPDRFILTGLPGAGKSFAVKHSMSRISSELSKTCLSENSFTPKNIIIPIIVDLKLYKGDLFKLIEETLPSGLKLDYLLSTFQVKIYLDAFNEIPREYIEANTWDIDFSNFLKLSNTASIVITSRTADGLDDLEMPVFNIDLIEKEFVKTHLLKKGVEIKGLFEEEVFEILRKPFFYDLISKNILKITSDINPRKIYLNLLDLINTDFQNRFEIKFNLVPALSEIAMNAIDSGDEAFSLISMTKTLQKDLAGQNIYKPTGEEVINWLISRKFLIPLVNERLSFFHQSITEFLASTKLAKAYENDSRILKTKLSFQRWDHALFQTLSQLSNQKSIEFLKTIISIDFELALSAVKYMEYGSERVVKILLSEIPNRSKLDFQDAFSYAYKLRYSLPILESHIPALKKIINCEDALGGAAASRILSILGDKYKDTAIELLATHCEDYNFCTSIAYELINHLKNEDLSKLVKITDKVQKKLSSKEIKKYEGFDAALGDALQNLSAENVFKTFFNSSIPIKEQEVRLAVLCDFLQDSKSEQSLSFALELLLLEVLEAATVIYFITAFSKQKEEIDWSIIKNNHVKKLIHLTKNGDEELKVWAMSGLKNICHYRKDFNPVLLREFENTTSIVQKTAMLYIVADNNNYSKVFECLQSLLKLHKKELDTEKFDLISHMHMNWNGNEVLFIDLLKLRNVDLAMNLCDSTIFDSLLLADCSFDIGPIKWWLNWFLETSKDSKIHWMFEDRVSWFISSYLTKENKQQILDEINNLNSIYRKTIPSRLVSNSDISITDLTPQTVNYLINELKKKECQFEISLLEEIATESFVKVQLMPLLEKSKGHFKRNLSILIKEIGKKHGIRYMVA